MNKEMILRNVDQIDRTLHIDLWYLDVDDNIEYFQIGLMSVRASDDIRISYDFQRDGWKIEQESISNWQEVSFIKAWQLEK